MTETKKEPIKYYWLNTPELFSEKYESDPTHFFSPASLFLNARRKKVIQLAGKPKNKALLDVGCGSGIFMLEFIKRGAKVTGVDYSKKMIELARKLLEKYKIEKRYYKLMVSRASDLKFSAKSFDIILATGLIDYIPQKESEIFLEKSSKLLKKNGLIIVSFPSTKSPFAFLRKGIGLAIRRKFFHLPPIAHTFDKNQIEEMLERHGFKIVEISKIYSAMWIVKANLKQKL